MSTHLRFDEDHSDYEPTDSDDDYDENAKILLDKVRNRGPKHSDSEEEVYGVGSDEDEDLSDIALSDVEGQEDNDNLPDVRAWGKDKRKFYSTDYVDADYGGFQGKDAELAEFEEEEARNLQQQLAQQLDDDDFCLDLPTKQSEEEENKISEEVIKSDISKLSKRQKLQILRKESPEFFGLVEDLQSKMHLLKDYLIPILTKHDDGEIPDCGLIKFITTMRDMILNYATNVQMYLLLKASRVQVQNHPIIKRLYQYRQLLSQLSPVYDEIIKPQIDVLLLEESTIEKVEIPQGTLDLVNSLLSEEKTKGASKKLKKKKQSPVEIEKPAKKVKFSDEVQTKIISEETEDKSDNDETENAIAEDENSEVGKRAITYKMAKNKGLTPYRKKELRNPRVKHRNKFRKAKIRRKGAVREARTELKKYGGEISGINAAVSKSIKIKS